jgi:type I restriction enzyme S subunit
MNPEFLLTHFDRISEAPDAIPCLRRFILDLAVRGRLVEHDPSDEPASQLLNEIRAEKALLLKQRGAHTPRQLVTTAADHSQFVPPRGWILTTLGEVAHKITDGAHKTPTYLNQGVPFISVKNFSGGKLDFSHTRLISPAEHALLYKRCDPRRGDILIGRIGTLGKAVLVDTDREFSLFVSVGLIRFSQTFIAPPYFRMVLNSPLLESEYNRIKVGGGTHTNKLNLGDLHTLIFPLPPLAEQHRIVAKVDELMALCDRLETTQRERETRRKRLTASGLHHLSDGTTSEAFRKHARFYLDHLPHLTMHPDQVPGLRQGILSLAVQGKLVHQSPNHEQALNAPTILPAPRVRGKQENLADEPWPNKLPDSWSWHRLEAISERVTDGEHATPPRIDDQQVPLVTAKNVRDGSMDYANTDWVSYETAAKAWRRCRPSVGDLLLVCVGATTGRLCVLQEPRDMVLVRSVALIRPTSAIQVDYLAMVLRSPLSQRQIWEKVKATAQPCLYINRINSLSIPLPPLAEQHRIVAKVDELMALCDRLETQLTTAQSETGRLLESVLHHALNDAVEIASPNRLG